MNLREVINGFVGKRVNFSPHIWAMAVLLGQARENSNRRRLKTSDRGPLGNSDVDLIGSAAELGILRRLVELNATRAVSSMQQHMFNPSGGSDVNGADVIISCPDGAIMIDIKSFDCAPNKRMFAINDHKHDSLRKQCDAYIGLIAPHFARMGYLSNLVPYGDVDGWRVGTLRQGGSPSRNMPIADFLVTYMNHAVNVDQIRQSVFPKDEITRLSNDVGEGSARSQIMDLLPDIKGYI